MEETIKIKKKRTSTVKRRDIGDDNDINKSLKTVIDKLNKLKTGSEYMHFLSKLEELNKTSLERIKETTNIKDFSSLYPHINDPLFNLKIYSKKEFNDLKTDDTIYNVDERSDEICNQIDFELLPHQLFVRNFLSFHTPYNSLLLFHGLGTGKTCSGITVCEEMRDYMKQMGINKRIIIIAPPNILDNFRLQLFDERKLKLINGYWNLNACTGNKLINEINPMNMRGLSKQQVVKQIKNIINSYYAFFGPEKFANYVERILSNFKDIEDHDVKKRKEINALKREFSNRLILIDEVHNIRSEDSESKKVAKYLFPVIENAENIKLLLLSATPMFNSYDEIVWLINLMNMNDGRTQIEISDIFDKDGYFKKDDAGNEVGKELLISKATGYISYLRGENPYSFPFRIYPSMFMKTNTIKSDNYIFPSLQMNGYQIDKDDRVKYLDLCITEIGEYQQEAYNYIVDYLSRTREEHFTSNTGGMGYSILSNPIQALNMTYPLDLTEEPDELTSFVGKGGLARTMKYDKETKRKFQYRQDTIDNYGRIFSPSEIKKYSSKIKFITDNILQSDGIVLIYSQYIEGGCIPIALALEEVGITRYGNNNDLFIKPPSKQIDAISLSDTAVQNPAKYIMITGDNDYSPNNVEEIKAATSSDNINGEKVKVIIISSAGSEGIDFKYVRQIHCLDPWFNINRIEQIIGRGVRFCSHKELPIEKRNVEIYLHASQLSNKSIESADLYIYRLAEQKAIKIGLVTRVLKETSVDCNLNKMVYTKNKMNQTIQINLSSQRGEKIEYKVGDTPYTSLCDFMSNCEYKCLPDVSTYDEININMDTFNEGFIKNNNDIIINKIKSFYKDGYIYTKKYIIERLIKFKAYPLIQIDSALDKMVNDKSIFIYDQFNRRGNLGNIKNYYFFQPIEIDDIRISLYDRSRPIDGKFPHISVELTKEIQDNEKDKFNIKSYLKNLREMFRNTQLQHEYTSITKEVDWYKSAGNAFKRLETLIIDNNLRDKIVVEHMVDSTEPNERIRLIEYVLKSGVSKDNDDFIKLLHTTIEKKFITIGKKKFIMIYNGELLISYVLNEDKMILEKAQPRDDERIKTYFFEKHNNLQFNDIIGFNSLFNNKYIVFKTRDLTIKRNSGARCDQKPKSGIENEIEMLFKNANLDNNILKISYMFSEDSKKGISKNKKIQNTKELCADLEILHRYLDINNVKNMRWFLNTEEYELRELFQKK